jgi:hypothetical protein
MQPQPKAQLVFSHDAGPAALQFGHLHGKPIDLDLIAKNPELRRALLKTEPPTIRLAEIHTGRFRRLDYERTLDWIELARGMDGFVEE